MVKITKLANDLGVTRVTIWNWKYKGDIEFIKVGGTNYVSQETYDRLTKNEPSVKNKSVVIYCRVSSSENKRNLDSQKDRMISYCNAKGYSVSEVICEIGSGLNDHRPKLERLLKEQKFDTIVVEHKDRLTRFGFNYIETLLAVHGKTIEVVNPVDDEKQDLIQDFVSVITSFCARIYGQRRSKRKTEQLIKSLNEEIEQPLNNSIEQ